MRITVNLSHFFTDHRSKAKIYVKENMKYIQDLQRRISKIFEIDNFYLNCENHYLPPYEDVRLLNYDDIVWAIPISENKPASEQESSAGKLVETEEIELVKKKKKKKRNKQEIPPLEVEIKKRNCKSKNESTTIEDKATNNEQTSSTTEERSPTDKIEDSVFKDSGRDSLDSSKSDELSNEATNVNVRSLVDTFENKIDFKKHIELLNKNSTVMETNKRINIVKTIIVHNSLTDCNANVNIPMKNEISPLSHVNITDNNTEKNTQNDDDVFETPKSKTNGLDSGCGASILDSTVETSCSSSLESGNFKRKRVRIRKRKRINKPVEPIDTLKKPIYDLIPRPLLAQSKNPRHVRFKEDSNEQENETVIITDDSTEKREELQEKVQSSLSSEKMIVEEPKQIVQKTAIEKELTEEFILKQPIMQNMQPRQGDIVAFRVLRISDSYTPEISSRIVGKISSYNPPNAEVIFDIISGQDQCVQPQGKFTLVTEEVTGEKNSSHYNCKWSDLLEPRLLFP